MVPADTFCTCGEAHHGLGKTPTRQGHCWELTLKRSLRVWERCSCRDGQRGFERLVTMGPVKT